MGPGSSSTHRVDDRIGRKEGARVAGVGPIATLARFLSESLRNCEMDVSLSA
jgi:hypothetical protein